jgi:hypothetical protein
LCPGHNARPETFDSRPNDARGLRAYLARPKHTTGRNSPGQEETMQRNQTQKASREKLSLGAMMLTIVLANVLVLVYIAPYT